MAIKTTEDRLNEMVLVESSAPGIKVSYLEPLNEDAVKTDTVARNVQSLPADATPSEKLDATATIKIDDGEPENLSDAEPVLVAAVGPIKMFGKAVKEQGKQGALSQQKSLPTPANPNPSGGAADLKQAEESLQTFEQTIEAFPSTGKPPNVPINVDRVDGPDDFKQSITALSNAVVRRDNTMTFEQTKADALARGTDPRQLSDLDAFIEKYGDLPSEMVELRLAAIGNNRVAYESFRKAYLNPDDLDAQAEVLVNIAMQQRINQSYEFVRTRAAQANAAGRIQITEGMVTEYLPELGDVPMLNAGSDEIKAILADRKTSANLRKAIARYVELDDPISQQDMLTRMGKTGLVGDLIDLSWKNGLLSATGTHFVNLTSNASFLASTVVTRQLAGVVSTLTRASGGRGEVELGEAASMIAGMVHAQKDAFSLAYKALRTGTNVEMRKGFDLGSDAGMRYEGQYKIFNARDYGIETELFVKSINGFANLQTFLGGRPIMAMDEYFKTIGYRAELYAQAYRAQNKARRDAIASKLSPDEAERLGLKAMEDVLTNPSPEVTATALEFSHMITFSKSLTGSAAQVQELAKTTLAGRMVLPFVKAPIWLGSESLQHSYLAPLSKQFREDIRAGGAKRELAIAKFGMGTTLMTAVGFQVADGRITGGGPGNTALRQQYMASGWRPYSFVFRAGEWDDEFIAKVKSMGIDPSIAGDGRLYVPYRGFDPISGPLAIIADTVEFARYEDDTEITTQVIMGSIWGLYNYIGEQPVMTGLQQITGAFSTEIPNPKMAFANALDGLTKQGLLYASSPIGFQSMRNQVARSIDPERRDVRADPYLPTGVAGLDNYLNYMYSITPGLSEDLPATHDYLGRPEYRGDPANPWTSAALGVRYSEDLQSEADKIINNTQVPLQKPRASIGVEMPNGSINVKLTPVEHQELLKSISEVVARFPVYNPQTGRSEDKILGLQEAIVAVASQPGFMTATKLAKQQAIKDVYASYVGEARTRLLMNNPQIVERAQMAYIDRDVYGVPR